MTEDATALLDRAIRAKGKPVSTEPLDKTLRGGRPNQNPTYRYRFADNTYLDVRGRSPAVEGDNTPTELEVIRGTALRDLAEPDKTAPAPRPAQAPATVQRPTGRMGTTSDAHGDISTTGPETETVTKAQADYDQQTTNDAWTRRRAELADLQRAAQAVEAQHIAEARLALEQRKASRDEINADLDRKLQALNQQVTAAAHAITQRGNDQTYELGMARAATDLAQAELKDWVPPGQLDSFNATLTGLGGKPIKAGPMPFNPRTFGMEVAQAARAQEPPRYALPGAQTEQSTTYRMPG